MVSGAAYSARILRTPALSCTGFTRARIPLSSLCFEIRNYYRAGFYYVLLILCIIIKYVRQTANPSRKLILTDPRRHIRMNNRYDNRQKSPQTTINKRLNEHYNNCTGTVTGENIPSRLREKRLSFGSIRCHRRYCESLSGSTGRFSSIVRHSYAGSFNVNLVT